MAAVRVKMHNASIYEGALNLELSEEQRLLRESVAAYLSRGYSFEARRGSLTNGGWRPDAWRDFAGLGLLGASLPEALNGHGGGPVETMLICEEFGKALVLEPYLETVVLGARLLRDGGAACAHLLRAVVDGSVRLAPALLEEGTRFDLMPLATRAERSDHGWKISGTKTLVTGAPCATHLLISARTDVAKSRKEVSLFIVPVDVAGFESRNYRLIDGRCAADIELEGVSVADDALVGDCGGACGRIERAMDEAIAALCAEALGVMRSMLTATLEYARQREQFGRSIASFQVLQHRMVDMYTRIERSQSMVLMATLALDLPEPERGKRVSAAKAFISRAVRFVAQSAMQIHGGIGTTEELAISHYFRRATVIESQFGSAAYHLRRMSRELEREPAAA
jgi:alkylation response protein AidB-like acyl-CoA dehydrogenase